jgi:Uma2 family endonuclease
MSEMELSQPLSPEEYLAREGISSVRHEYVDGHVFAMTGGSLRHNIICTNLWSVLQGALRGGPCRSFISDVKVRIDSCNSFYYPDVLVSCKPTDASGVFLKAPVLLAEVLSPSTASTDRREKLIAYKQIESLREYLIIHQSIRRVDLYRKQGSAVWLSSERIVDGGTVTCQSIQVDGMALTFRIAEIYADIDWAESDSASVVREEVVEQYIW